MYLTQRGLNADNMKTLWGVQGIGHAPRLRWRLFIPIHHHGEIVSWTTRAINPRERQRYISAGASEEAIPHKTLLYGADYARHAIIIHEGPIDVWATGPGAVATCGTAYTEAQLKTMSHYPIRVVCFDADADAQARARVLANALSVYPGSTHNVRLETGKDTAEADWGEVQELRETFLGDTLN
jgi:DNA primase